jgi:hypothetical protein
MVKKSHKVRTPRSAASQRRAIVAAVGVYGVEEAIWSGLLMRGGGGHGFLPSFRTSAFKAITVLGHDVFLDQNRRRTNCYFADDSSGFPVLIPFFDVCHLVVLFHPCVPTENPIQRFSPTVKLLNCAQNLPRYQFAGDRVRAGDGWKIPLAVATWQFLRGGEQTS